VDVADFVVELEADEEMLEVDVVVQEEAQKWL
jgi:hypothetical protein